jgi:drug/metabolite transporter (DMT)-like permease
MAWTYIILYIVFATIWRVLARRTLQQVSAYSYGLVNEWVASLTFLPFAIAAGFGAFKHLDVYGWVGLASAGLLWTFLALLGNKTIQKTEMSIREPLSQLRTLAGFFVGVYFLRESTTLLQYVGVALIFIGALVTVYHPGKHIKQTITQEGVLLVIASSFLYAIVAAFDKLNATTFPPVVYGFFVYTIPALLLLGMLPFRHADFKQFTRRHAIHTIISSMLQAACFYLMLKAFQVLPFTVAYPSIQIATITSALAGPLIFGERTNMVGRIIGLMVSVVGVLLIKL